MGKYTNTWLKTDSNNHDCANDGTCGQSIRDFRIDDSNISFHDGDGKTIAQIPKLPNGNSVTYHNNLYKTAQSRNFGENIKYVGLQDVLPNQFNFEYGKLNCIIHCDNVLQREKDQIKLDIQNAYEAYKAKFCIASDTQVTVHTYIFNNKDDYRGYGTLLPGLSMHQYSLNISSGMTNGKSVLLYKNAYMDNVLAHELGHMFQYKFSTAKVRDLDYVNSQLMANAIGLEVEEKNYKAICKQMGVDEYVVHDMIFKFKYKGTYYQVQHKDLSEEEKLQIIQDIKSSHESLISECHRLNKGPLTQNESVVILVNENKDISEMCLYNPNKSIKQLDKTLISRSKPEQDVDDTDPKPGKEPEPESGKEPKEDVSRSKPEQDVDDTDPKPGKEPEPESGKEPKEDVSRSKPEQDVDEVDHTEGKEPEEDTQQPSNFLSNIFSTIIDSISSFFSWLFGSKEEEQSDNNPSLLELNVDQSNHDADENYVGNHSLYNHDYQQHDDLI